MAGLGDVRPSAPPHRFVSPATSVAGFALGLPLRGIANERHRFGYRRLAILPRREGKSMNLKRAHRLYREERLTVHTLIAIGLSALHERAFLGLETGICRGRISLHRRFVF